MHKKFALTLLLIVLLPTGLLGWFGVRMASNEQRVIEHQVQALLNAQLKNIDESIQTVFQSTQKDLLSKAAQLKVDNDSLRAFVRNSPQVSQVFVIGADGKRIFPSTDGPRSDAENQFLQRTAAIWNSYQILFQSDARATSQANATSKLSTLSRSSSGDAEQSRNGWYAWHWNAELHHIFWLRDSANRLVGFELSPVRLMSDIVARLPATGGSDDTLVNARIRLINANGQIAYQWGAYQPSAEDRPLAMLPLNHPLSSWKLEYYGASLKAGVVTNWFGVLAAIVLVALGLAGLAIYLYREQTREMRMAEQRVNFVNQVSHELKTPLTNIRMYAELLEDELADETDKPRKYIAIITAESQRLSRLIANVLNFARAQKEHLVLHPQPGRVDEVIAKCIEAFSPALAAKGVAIRFDANAVQQVMLDAEILEQILNNLFGNVEKYAASGGAMEVSSKQEGERTLIRVRDFGPGIPKRERERVFRPFYRISSKLSDGVSGTGIGLGIARQLARLHGGDLTLADMEPGACFEVALVTQASGGQS
ncbi:MAG: HAMP domain-containing histidine kinase [Burkholderiales bacterium]|nr:HAMP domain-containing histidine kinase [Burkholderiales bacterium]